MSAGSRDQLYLALRLAALELQVEQGLNMPLIADDPFINLDDRRTAAGLKMLSIQAVESPFKDGRCVIQSLDDLRRFALVMMSLDHLQPWSSAHVAAAVEGLEREIPFDNVGPR